MIKSHSHHITFFDIAQEKILIPILSYEKL